MRPLRTYLRRGFYVLWGGCVVHCLFKYVGRVVMACGPSMEPTIVENDILLVNNRTVRDRKVKRGDVVISISPQDPLTVVCKRVKALQFEDIPNDSKGLTVPKGHMWLEGDNKANSIDSKVYGAVPYGLLKGKVFYRIFPFDRIGKVK